MPETDDAQPKPKGKLKLIMMLVAMLAIEAVVIVGALALFSGPADVQAESGLEDDIVAADEQLVEQLVVDARFANAKRGVTYLYDTEVYIQVKTRYQTPVAEEIERFRNEIKAELNAIWRLTEPQYFEEPNLEFLTRKVYAQMTKRFGIDQETGDPIVDKVVIVMGTGFRVDN
ncbi:MAG: hypothetical protein ACYTF9_13555 [Planctomycetota bacterium]